ncbi:nitrous oxide reductase accessory protein NosL [Desulforhabdus amnigena]|uniref:NosL family protein n=1 Tax=Desulforhabdus amnigena TaxID=40218 RepID=A0A9W6FS87_9BACT|nr:nitrous oxide reductase accessory protein NosL [Desulforhabdus amnigena]GLI33798.1 NosL family protein [Desulforhabdus amnigena]
MKKGIFAFCIMFAFFVTSSGAFAEESADIQMYPSCIHCGMDRKMFAHSRIFIEFDDGTTLGTCSVHCAAIDLAEKIDKTPQSIQVGDYNTRKLIDAETAFWVIGGNKPGVMTRNAKWAFATKEDALKFIEENGGVPASFDDVMKATYEDMYSDTKMIREKRRMRKMQMEQKKQ